MRVETNKLKIKIKKMIFYWNVSSSTDKFIILNNSSFVRESRIVTKIPIFIKMYLLFSGDIVASQLL